MDWVVPAAVAVALRVGIEVLRGPVRRWNERRKFCGQTDTNTCACRGDFG